MNSCEHGDGRVRSAFNPRVFGDDLYEAMRKVKALFDPQGRLNPGVMVDAPPITENLRDPALPAARSRWPPGCRSPSTAACAARPTAASASAPAARPAAA